MLSSASWESPGSSWSLAQRLVTYLKTLDSSLLESEWADKEIKPYVASRIAVCVQTFVPDSDPDTDAVVQVPPDLSVLVPLFPAPAAELFGGPARHLAVSPTTGSRAPVASR